jgi:hypothetical protein
MKDKREIVIFTVVILNLALIIPIIILFIRNIFVRSVATSTALSILLFAISLVNAIGVISEILNGNVSIGID